MVEHNQRKITGFFSSRGRIRLQGSRRRHNDNAKYLSDEKAKLKARLKLVGEETRTAYADLERDHPRVKAAFDKTYMTTRCAPIPRELDAGLPTEVSVVNADTLDAALSLHQTAPDVLIGVLNMASDKHVGGGFLSGAPAQEESLCRRSTLYPCLMSVKNQCYPLSATAVLVSPDVLVFRTGIDDSFRIMPPTDRFFVTIVSVAAIRSPPIDNDRFKNHIDRQLTATKVRETLRAAYHAGCRQLVLGALGCGAFHNPPKAVAEVFRDVLQETEFKAAFEKLTFAVIDHRDVTHGTRQTNNLDIFQQIISGSLTPSDPLQQVAIEEMTG